MKKINIKKILITWNSSEKTINDILKKNKNALHLNVYNIAIPPKELSSRSININYVNAKETASQIVEYFDLVKYDSWDFLDVEKINENDEHVVRILIEELSRLITFNIMLRNTEIKQTINFIKNIFINAPISQTKIKFNEFNGALVNMPFVIVAAGPSLDKQLKLLEDHQEYFYIIAVDKAVPSLKKHCITPDFVISIDPKSTPSWSQNDLDDKTIFITDIGSHPSMSWSNNKNHIFISSQTDIELISRYFGINVDFLETGGSVATSAFSFSQFCGGNPIIFIGQDLAFTDNKDHAIDYINPYSSELIKSKIDSGLMTESYYGGRVITSNQLLIYKIWFESKFLKIDDRLIFNCTEGGVNLNGAINLPFETMCQEMAKIGVRKTSLLKCKINSDFDIDKIHDVINKIDSTIKILKPINDTCLEACLLLENCIVMTKKISMKIEDSISMINSIDPTLKNLISKFNEEELYLVNKIMVRDERKSNINLLKNYHDFLKATNKSINNALNYLNLIYEIYDFIIKNRVEISSDSIEKIINKFGLSEQR